MGSWLPGYYFHYWEMLFIKGLPLHFSQQVSSFILCYKTLLLLLWKMFGTRSFPPVDTQTHINWGTLVSGWRLLRWINSRLSETSSMSAASSAGLTDRTGVGITGGWNYTVSPSRTGKTFIPVDGRSLGSTGTEFKLPPESPPETSDTSATAVGRFCVLADILFRSTHVIFFKNWSFLSFELFASLTKHPWPIFSGVACGNLTQLWKYSADGDV